MAIEIRELIIKATVNTNQGESNPSLANNNEEKQLLIQECVDQVMEILKEKMER